MLENGKMGRLRRVFEVIFGHNVINRHFFRGICGHLFGVIRGHRPANLDHRIRLCVTSGNDICCLGRSMIEMLGVLAIIGVLSVGGIAGYSKAMTKWKINKTIEQIEHITYNTFTAYANQKEIRLIGSSDEDDINLLKSLGIISEDIIKDDNELREENDIRLKNPFGGDLWLFAYTGDSSYPGHSGEKFVSFEYYNIPREVCMALGSLDWAKGSASVIGVGISPNTRDAMANTAECWVVNGPSLDFGDWLVVCNNGVPNEDSGETEADRIPLPIPPDIVAEHCNCKDNDCYFGVAFTDK